MADEVVCSFHVLPFLTLQEVGRLQGACRALDDDFRCPETRVERLSNFAPRAVALAAPSLEHPAQPERLDELGRGRRRVASRRLGRRLARATAAAALVIHLAERPSQPLLWSPPA